MNLFNLIGKLVLDTSDYDKGIEEAKGKNSEFVESTGKSTAAAVAKWAAVAAAVAKVISTVKKLVVDSTQYADNIKNMAQIYGYSVREIQEMQSVAEQSGKSLERVLRGIKSSGQTAAEYLGLSADEYAAMVDEAYKFGTILKEDALNAVDALGDRITYLKGQWTAAITALLANEEGAEQALEAFFDNVGDFVEQYAPTIARFAVRLFQRIVLALVKVAPQIISDLIDAIIEEFFAVNWIEVGYNIITGIAKGIFKGIGRFFGKLFGINTESGTQAAQTQDFAGANIAANDYEVTENVTQKIDVNLKYEGDTPLAESNAQAIGNVVAQQIDEILGRRLNG